jgi:hypothetical protein
MVHVARWIVQLLNEGVRPEIYLIEECAAEDAPAREVYWIAYGRENGWPLTNIADGGNGVINAKTGEIHRGGWHHSDEAKAKISAAHKGRVGCGYEMTTETREKNRQAQLRRGRPNWSEEGYARMVASSRGRKWSDESRKRARKAALIREEKKRQSKNHQGPLVM